MRGDWWDHSLWVRARVRHDQAQIRRIGGEKEKKERNIKNTKLFFMFFKLYK